MTRLSAFCTSVMHPSGKLAAGNSNTSAEGDLVSRQMGYCASSLGERGVPHAAGTGVSDSGSWMDSTAPNRMPETGREGRQLSSFHQRTFEYTRNAFEPFGSVWSTEPVALPHLRKWLSDIPWLLRFLFVRGVGHRARECRRISHSV